MSLSLWSLTNLILLDVFLDITLYVFLVEMSIYKVYGFISIKVSYKRVVVIEL
jgi:hypothetical protein